MPMTKKHWEKSVVLEHWKLSECENGDYCKQKF
jgi:hypothetical protein